MNKFFLLIFVFIVSATQLEAFEDSSLEDSLISYWQLEETSGTRVDSQGTNDLTENNGVEGASGKQGTAADFNQENDQYLSISDLLQSGLDISGSISISLWIKMSDLSEPQIFVHKYNGNSNRRAYTFYWHNGLLTACLSQFGSVPNCKTTPFNFNLNDWYHVAFTWDVSSDIGKIYVNSVQVGNDLSYNIVSINNSSESLLIGSNEYIQTFDGVIDEVGIWSRALTQEEIVQLYNNGEGLPFEVEIENSYPLYTQVTSTYPSLEETTEWADDQYASGSAASTCGETIEECGCTITSLLMSARNAGIEEDILGNDVNPANMNDYLESVEGYTSYGSLRWLAAQAYFGELTSEGTIASRFAYSVQRPTTEVSAMSLIDESLTSGNNAVIAYKNGHFVWLPEKNDDSYIVRDPWWYDTQTANDTDTPGQNYIRDYDNAFTDVRVIPISDEPIEMSGSDIEVHLRGTAEMLFKNAVGEVGYTPGGIVIDLERASYGDTENISLVDSPINNGKHLLVYEAGNEFTIDVVGTGFGTYTLELFTIDEYGEITTFEFSGTTTPGITTTLLFNLETDEVTESEITFEQFLDILDSQLVGATLQQQKFFKKWAAKIYENMEEKTVSQAVHSIDTYKKLLLAKKIDSPVTSSVLDLLASDLESGV